MPSAAQIEFQSTLPAWGETCTNLMIPTSILSFQSTLPAWGETQRQSQLQHFDRISIHSPRMGRDLQLWLDTYITPRFHSTLRAWGETRAVLAYDVGDLISIHSPRMGRDCAVGFFV